MLLFLYMLNKQSVFFTIIFLGLFIWNISLQVKSNELVSEIRSVRNTSEWTEDQTVLNEDLNIEKSESINDRIDSVEFDIINLQSQLKKNENLMNVNDALLRQYVEELNAKQTEHMYEVIKIYHP